jgi:hypothetical protein
MTGTAPKELRSLAEPVAVPPGRTALRTRDHEAFIPLAREYRQRRKRPGPFGKIKFFDPNGRGGTLRDLEKVAYP